MACRVAEKHEAVSRGNRVLASGAMLFQQKAELNLPEATFHAHAYAYNCLMIF